MLLSAIRNFGPANTAGITGFKEINEGEKNSQRLIFFYNFFASFFKFN